MIKEIYIDNFRCLVNFRIQPGQFQLWLGSNGSGKTSVLDALRKIQQVLAGRHVHGVFSANTKTDWINKADQEFGVVLEIGGEEYEYRLVIEHDKGKDVCLIKSEYLKWQGEHLYSFDGQEAHLYRVNGGTSKTEEIKQFPVDRSRSMISNVAERADNVPLFHFRRNVEKWLIIQPIPLVVEQTAQKEIQHLTRYAENFAQWYRHVIQEDGSVVFGAYEQLKEVLPGFVCLNLRESGNSRVLTVTFLIADQDRVFEFQDVSDGQRQLIILYLIAEALRKGLVSTLILDEPDNFVSLREVRPFLGLLEEITDELPQQAIIISHHPEVINEMGHEGELWFSRREGAHTTTKPYPVTPGLTPAENMARGWGDE